MTLIHKEYDLPKGCNITSVVMRETDGEDERAAGLAADAKKTMPGEELLKRSIVRINSEKISTGSAPVQGYNTKTRRALGAYYDDLNDLKDEELGPLLAGAKEVDPDQ